MKTVEIRHGCLDAGICGAQDHHTCGSPDACSVVRPNGIVCTFGTTSRVTFHDQADIDAEVNTVHQAIRDIDPTVILGPVEKARTKLEVLKGKNLHSAKAEKEFRDGGAAHHTANRTLHDTHPEVFHG